MVSGYIELQINKANNSDIEAPFLVLHKNDKCHVLNPINCSFDLTHKVGKSSKCLIQSLE